jgi:hypothetical protein
MKHKTTLCTSCEFGIVWEWEEWKGDPMEGIQAKCLLSNAYVEVVTSCNKFKRVENKVTYHDPTFGDYEKKIQE